MEQLTATEEAQKILTAREMRQLDRDSPAYDVHGHAPFLLPQRCVSSCRVFLDGSFTVAEIELYLGEGKKVTTVGVAKFNPNDCRTVKTSKGVQKISCYNRSAGIHRAIHRAIVNAEKEIATARS